MQSIEHRVEHTELSTILPAIVNGIPDQAKVGEQKNFKKFISFYFTIRKSIYKDLLETEWQTGRKTERKKERKKERKN